MTKPVAKAAKVSGPAVSQLAAQYVEQWVKAQNAKEKMEELKELLFAGIKPGEVVSIEMGSTLYNVTNQESHIVLTDAESLDKLHEDIDKIVAGGFALCLETRFSASKLTALEKLHPKLRDAIERVPAYSIYVRKAKVKK